MILLSIYICNNRPIQQSYQSFKLSIKSDMYFTSFTITSYSCIFPYSDWFRLISHRKIMSADTRFPHLWKAKGNHLFLEHQGDCQALQGNLRND